MSSIVSTLVSLANADMLVYLIAYFFLLFWCGLWIVHLMAIVYALVDAIYTCLFFFLDNFLSVNYCICNSKFVSELVWYGSHHLINCCTLHSTVTYVTITYGRL